MWILFFVLYAFLSFHVNFRFEYSNGYEFLVGTIITPFILIFIDTLIYKYAFRLTGEIGLMINGDWRKMKCIHWFIRSLLLLIVFLLSFTPLPSLILSPLVSYICDYVKTWGTSMIDSTFGSLIDAVIQ